MEDYEERGSLTIRQAEELRRLLPKGTPTAHLSRFEAAGLIALRSPDSKWRREKPTEKQDAFLRKHDLWKDGLNREEAADIIGQALAKEKEEPGYLSMLIAVYLDKTSRALSEYYRKKEASAKQQGGGEKGSP